MTPLLETGVEFYIDKNICLGVTPIQECESVKNMHLIVFCAQDPPHAGGGDDTTDEYPRVIKNRAKRI